MHVFPVPHTERLVTVDLKQFYIYSQFLGTCMYVCTYVCICVCVCVCVCVCMVAQMVKHLSMMQETGFDPWVGKIPWRRK